MTNPPITNSEMQTYQQCQRKWKFQYHDQIAPTAKSQALELGTKIHDQLEKYYNQQITNPADGTEPDTLEHTMLDGYHQWLQKTGADKNWEIIDTEQTITTTLGQNEIRGKYDLKIIDTTNNQTYLVDHKTAQDFRLENYSRLLAQFRLYHLIQDNNNQPNSGTWLNMLRKSKQQRYSPIPYYKRHLIPTVKTVIQKDRKRITQLADQINQTRKHPETCQPTFSTQCSFCPYKEPCWAQDEDNTPIRQYIGLGFKKQDPNDRYKQP